MRRVPDVAVIAYHGPQREDVNVSDQKGVAMIPARPLLGCVVLPFLAACSSTTTPAVDARNEIAAEYNRQVGLYATDPVVTAANLPVTGGAQYDGAIRLLVDTVGTTEILGRAEVEVDFFNDEVDAGFSDFFGRANGGAVVAWTETSAMLSDGAIDVVQPSSQFIQTTLTGALRSDNGDVLRIFGIPLDGTFRDATFPSAATYPDALILQSGAGNIQLNGLNYAVELGNDCETCVWVIAEN